jgi:hypothetical protein
MRPYVGTLVALITCVGSGLWSQSSGAQAPPAPPERALSKPGPSGSAPPSSPSAGAYGAAATPATPDCFSLLREERELSALLRKKVDVLESRLAEVEQRLAKAGDKNK